MTTFSPTEPILEVSLEAATARPADQGFGVTRSREFTLAQRPRRTAVRCNVGRTEQKVRVSVGTAMIAAAAFAPLSRGWRIALAAIGAVELVTGTTRYCPVSHVLGINTCRGDER